jgi:hypothetical protein
MTDKIVPHGVIEMKKEIRKRSSVVDHGFIASAAGLS